MANLKSRLTKLESALKDLNKTGYIVDPALVQRYSAMTDDELVAEYERLSSSPVSVPKTDYSELSELELIKLLNVTLKK